MQELQTRIQQFRSELYQLFPKRSDAIMNLLDALTSMDISVGALYN